MSRPCRGGSAGASRERGTAFKRQTEVPTQPCNMITCAFGPLPRPQATTHDKAMGHDTRPTSKARAPLHRPSSCSAATSSCCQLPPNHLVAAAPQAAHGGQAAVELPGALPPDAGAVRLAHKGLQRPQRTTHQLVILGAQEGGQVLRAV